MQRNSAAILMSAFKREEKMKSNDLNGTRVIDDKIEEYAEL